MPSVRVSITNLQAAVSYDAGLFRRAVRHVFQKSDRPVEIGVAVVDDPTIHGLNRRHLGHDYPTDVLSYPLEDSPERLQGEIVVSSETAQRNAPRYGWSAAEELCLYVVHGALHLAGYRDKSAAQQREMRAAERRVFVALSLAASTESSLFTAQEEADFADRGAEAGERRIDS